MKHRNWLDIAEYIMLFGSGVGSLASVASQQVIYTAAPLSFLALLNVVNRHRLQQQLVRIPPAITQLDRRSSAEVAALKQQVDDLPNADSFRQLRAIVMQKHQQTISQLAQTVSTLQTELTHQNALLQAHDLKVIDQAIQNLQVRSVNLEEALSEVTAYLNQVAAATRVNELEGTTAKFSADLTHLKTEVGQLQTHLQSLLDEQRNFSPRTLQDQIDHLNRRLSNFPQPFDASLLKKDIDSLLSVVTDLVSRRELSRVAAEVEKLHQQNRSIEQAVTVVRLASNVLRKQLDTVSAKVHAREATLQLHTTGNAAADLNPDVDLKRAVTKLAKGLVALQKRFNQQAISPDLSTLHDQLEQLVTDQVETMQQQLATVQQTTHTLSQEQQDLRQLINHFPETSDRTLSTQLSALIARIDWTEQRITQVEGFWGTLQAQVEATLKHQLESLTQPVVQDLVAQQLQQLANSQNTTDTLASRSSELMDDAQPSALPAQAIEHLNRLTNRVEWAETHIGTLQQQLNDKIQPQLDELNQQLQGLSPELELPWTTLADMSEVSSTLESVSPLLDNEQAVEQVEAESPPLPVDGQAAETVAAQLSDDEQITESVAEQSPASPTEDTELSAALEIDETIEPMPDATWEELPRGGLALLEAALAQTRDRIIIVSPYPVPETINAAMLQQLEAVLQRGGQIDIGWGHLVDEQQVRLPRCLHQPMIDTTQSGFLPNLLRQLAQMKQRYQQQFHFKILGTHENFWVCDHAFAVIGGFPVHGEQSDEVMGLRNTDPIVVQSLIERFDEPQPDPNNPIAFFNRGVTRYDLGDKQGAIADFTQVLQLDPEDDITFNNRGLARLQLGEFPGAMMDFNHALHLNRQNAVAAFNRGCTRTHIGDKLGAIDDFTDAIAHQPNFSLAFFCRAIAYTRLDNRPAAIDDYSAVITLDPPNAMAHFYRGVALFRSGQSQSALADLHCALDLLTQQNDRPNLLRVKAAINELVQASPTVEPNPSIAWPL